MRSLEQLMLTNNKLQNKSLPHTLTFCSKLHNLMLDNNLLDALPGFLLKMSSLETVHRHGNHNYFKSTFMWYHTDVNERILAICGTNDFHIREPQTLQFWAAKAMIGLKINFYTDRNIAPVLKDYISEIYTMFNVCGYCNIAKLVNQPGGWSHTFNQIFRICYSGSTLWELILDDAKIWFASYRHENCLDWQNPDSFTVILVILDMSAN